MAQGKMLRIDPKMFITNPYTKCPKCKKNASFGLLMVNPKQYTKRCRECLYSASYSLPLLDKTVIYLDQFVISDIMKALNEQLGKKEKVSSWFLDLFKELDYLLKAQLIICPDSDFHRQESLLSAYRPLKRMYEYLSNGYSLYDSSTIRRFQLSEDFRNLISGKGILKVSTDIDNVLTGTRNEWFDKIQITIDSKINPQEIVEYQAQRRRVSQGIKEWFESWKNQKPQSFNNYYLFELGTFGRMKVKKYAETIKKYAYSYITGAPMTMDEMFMTLSEEATLITGLFHYLPEDMPYDQQLQKVCAYLTSDRLYHLPFNEIQCALWAAITYQTTHGGRLSPPNVGMFNDIEMVATVLPYVDAVFVDRDMYSLLNFGEVMKIISKYKTKVFSASNKDKFFLFLKEIKLKTSNDHFDTIEKVYGKEWLNPYLEIYKRG